MVFYTVVEKKDATGGWGMGYCEETVSGFHEPHYIATRVMRFMEIRYCFFACFGCKL